MPQLTRCPHCSKPLQVPDDALGKPIRCPFCKQLFAVRAPTREPAAVSAGAGGSTISKAAQGPPAAPQRPAPAPPRTVAPPPASPSTSRVAKIAAKNTCPACQATLPPGATACPDCGYLLQNETTDLDGEEAPNLCPNPACGVANPPDVKVCQRCASPLPTPAGTVLHGRYRIEKLLAIGGFAAVYLGTDLKQGSRPVAIKDMICPDPQEFAVRLNFFQREAEMLRMLEVVPIVPRLYDFRHEGQSAQLVMEFIPGQDLLKVLETNGNKPFPLDQVVTWGKSVCDVLTHLHAQNPPLVHRDVKPDNIMLLEDQKTIKMIDFGTARDVGRSDKTRLAAKTRVYTEGYAPPEQIIGKPEPRSDLFALAGTLYHLATGKAPEGSFTARELEGALASGNGAIPAGQRWLFELIKINLSEDVNDRYFSCREFRADLERRQVSTETACPQCQAANPVRQPYCGKCAAPLTGPAPPCQHCGQVNRMGSRCCIYCGSRLR